MSCPFPKWALRRPGLIPVFFLLLTIESNGQNYLSGPRSLALGTCYTTSFCPSSTLLNPALLPIQSQSAFYLSHSRPFVTKELGISSLNITFALSNGTFSFTIQNYGIKGFHHFSSTLSYGLKLHENLHAGVSFFYANTLSDREWNYLWAIGIGGGLSYKPNKKTQIGIHLGNPITIDNYPKYGIPYASIMSLGFSRSIYERTKLYSEISYYSKQQYKTKLALSYSFKNITLNCGYHSNPQSLSFGSEIQLKKILLRFSYAWSSLPFSFPAFEISYYPRQ